MAASATETGRERVGNRGTDYPGDFDPKHPYSGTHAFRDGIGYEAPCRDTYKGTEYSCQTCFPRSFLHSADNPLTAYYEDCNQADPTDEFTASIDDILPDEYDKIYIDPDIGSKADTSEQIASSAHEPLSAYYEDSNLADHTAASPVSVHPILPDDFEEIYIDPDIGSKVDTSEQITSSAHDPLSDQYEEIHIDPDIGSKADTSEHITSSAYDPLPVSSTEMIIRLLVRSGFYIASAAGLKYLIQYLWNLVLKLPRRWIIMPFSLFNSILRWSWRYNPVDHHISHLQRVYNCLTFKRYESHVCIAGQYEQHLETIGQLLCSPPYNNCKKNRISQKCVNYTKHYTSVVEDFNGAEKIIFVAAAEPRMLIVCDNEESQLGEIFPTAEILVEGNIFLMVVGHSPSSNLKENQNFEEELVKCKMQNQPKIRSLFESGRFISVGVSYPGSDVQLSKCQQDKLIRFLNC